MAGTPTVLPGTGGVPLWLLGFLQGHFREPEDLSSIQSLTALLKQELKDCEVELLNLNRRLSLSISSWISHSSNVGRILSGIEIGPLRPIRDNRSLDKNLLVDLALLSKGVSSIQSLRLYAETVLRLETLVGNLEDATLSMMNHASRKKFENIFSKELSNLTATQIVSSSVAVMKDIEEVLAHVASNKPMWINLLISVDSRVEKSLAILRPQCLSDYRLLIASLGWPPSFSSTIVDKDDCMAMVNSLFSIQGVMKARFSQSFVALCSLQKLQMKREARLTCMQRNQAHNNKDFKGVAEVPFFRYGLWPIDELVNPLTIRMEYHFSKWLDQPKFIFALVYKMIQDFLDGVENVLQPLIDNAKLSGCSAKEAWVIAMVRMLLKYLERQVFSSLVKHHHSMDTDSEITSSFLNMVDLMITFDKRMSVLSSPGTRSTVSFASIVELAPTFSIMSIFNEHSDWLQLWAKIEAKDAERRLKHLLEDERSWFEALVDQDGHTSEKEESFLLLTREDFKAPIITDYVFNSAWAMIERGLALPCFRSKNQFIISSANLFLSHFFITLLQHSRDVEFKDAILDNAQLLRVCRAINAARYSEHVLREWSEDVNLMEMRASEHHPHNSLFVDGIMFLVKLHTDCLEEIVTAFLVHFDALCSNYVRASDQWKKIKQVDSDFGIQQDEPYLSISPSLIEALDMLRDRLQFLKLNLNPLDFLDVWRSIAGGLDHFFFASIPMGDAGFSSLGAYQFNTDMKALFFIFNSFCARPEAFFPCTSSSLKLLKI